MIMEARRFLTIHYMDGSSETFTFPKQAKDNIELMRKLHDAMTADRILIEAEQSLHLIPLSSVKRIEFSPTPDKLPNGIIRNALFDLSY
jgi:hypothetical protein